VLSAYHCTYHPSKDTGERPCDHSDGKRVAILGLHEFSYSQMNRYNKIPIIGDITTHYILCRCQVPCKPTTVGQPTLDPRLCLVDPAGKAWEKDK
jgi:hypothetical protein